MMNMKLSLTKTAFYIFFVFHSFFKIKNFGSELCISFKDRSKKTKWPLVIDECPELGDKSDEVSKMNCLPYKKVFEREKIALKR